MKAVELRSKTIKELRDQAIALRKENFNTRFQVASGQLDGLKKVRSNKRDIARIKTIITEKENIK